MKDYLNQEERTFLIILLAMEQTAEKFIKRDCISDDERKYLANVIKWSKKFNETILDRMGNTIRRKIVNTMALNELTLVGKYGIAKSPISESAQEDLEPAIQELHLFHCIDCKKCNYKDCAVYSISVACDIKETNHEDGCPFAQLPLFNDDYLEDEYDEY